MAEAIICTKLMKREKTRMGKRRAKKAKREEKKKRRERRRNEKRRNQMKRMCERKKYETGSEGGIVEPMFWLAF